MDQFIAEGNYMESILVEMEEAPVISQNGIDNMEVLKTELDHVQPDSFNESVDSNPEFDNWKKYPCLGCPEVFTSECNLQLHMDFDHEVKNLNFLKAIFLQVIEVLYSSCSVFSLFPTFLNIHFLISGAARQHFCWHAKKN